MATRYVYDEALGFCMQCFQLYKHTWKKMWDLNEEAIDVGDIFQGK
jgi:hypothetical protein